MLKWLCDVAELIQSHDDLDWDRVMAQAEALRSVRMVLLGLALVQKHLGVSSPKEIQRLIQQDSSFRFHCGKVTVWSTLFPWVLAKTSLLLRPFRILI